MDAKEARKLTERAEMEKRNAEKALRKEQEKEREGRLARAAEIGTRHVDGALEEVEKAARRGLKKHRYYVTGSSEMFASKYKSGDDTWYDELLKSLVEGLENKGYTISNTCCGTSRYEPVGSDPIMDRSFTYNVVYVDITW